MAPPDAAAVLGQIRDGRNLGAVLVAEAASRSGATVSWHGRGTAIATFADRQILISSYKSVESDLGSRIVHDKLWAKRFLRAAGVATPRWRTAATEDDAVRVAAELARPVVVKPRKGNSGQGITVNLTDPDRIRAAHRWARETGPVLVEVCLTITEEYRVIATADRCISVVKRVLPRVTGDGSSTVEDLIVALNRHRETIPSTIARPIPIDDLTRSFLTGQGFTLDTVLDEGTTITVRDVGGLSSGGEPHDVTATVEPSVKEIAAAAIAAIPGLGWGGVDVVRTASGDTFVIEINSDADISGATYPWSGEATDVAAEMIELRLAGSAPAPTSTPDVAALEGPGDSVESGALVDLFTTWLEGRGHRIAAATAGLIEITDPDGATLWLTAGGMTVSDLSCVHRVARSHSRAMSVLSAAGIGLVRGPWADQQRPKGTRIRVLASAEHAFAVVGAPGTSLSANDRATVGRIAVTAVRAVPQLRWAGVDIVLTRPFRRPKVEGITVTPTIDTLLAGSLEPLFELIAEGLRR